MKIPENRMERHICNPTWCLHRNVIYSLVLGMIRSSREIDTSDYVITKKNYQKRKLVLCDKNSNIGQMSFIADIGWKELANYYQDVGGEIMPVGNYTKGGICAIHIDDNKIVFEINTKPLQLIFHKMFVYDTTNNNILFYMLLDKEINTNVGVNIEIDSYQSLINKFYSKLNCN